MSPLSYRDSDGSVKQLKLTEQEFRNVVGAGAGGGGWGGVGAGAG